MSWHKGIDVQVGEHTYGAPKILGKKGVVRIGKYCSIAPEVVFLPYWDHRLDAFTTFPLSPTPSLLFSKGPIIIKNDVWLGFRVVVLSGVTIGNGAVVGACSVVTKDIPDYTVYVGNPAKLLKYRFSQEIIDLVLRVSWWDWPHEQALEYASILQGSNWKKLLKVSAIGK